MKSIGFSRYAIGNCVTAALLAGCAAVLPLSPSKGQDDMQPPTGAPATIPQRPAHGTKTFSYTGAEQNFKVPRGVTQLTVVATGASGPSGGSGYCYYTGGNGGVIKATIPVISGETLSVYVGGEGIGAGSNCSPGGTGGFNGGGNGGGGISGGVNGTGGGGASDVREGGDTLGDRVLVSGGGGGGGQTTGLYGAGAGGAGGGRVGGGGTDYKCSPAGFGGKGGRQDVGGKGGRGGQRSCGYFHRGARGYRGALGVGGDGGGYARNRSSGGGGGGGGGGYYGGGGGGAGSWSTSGVGGGGGGGGGSSYAEPRATDVKDRQGAAQPGNGQVVISW